MAIPKKTLSVCILELLYRIQHAREPEFLVPILNEETLLMGIMISSIRPTWNFVFVYVLGNTSNIIMRRCLKLKQCVPPLPIIIMH